MIGTMLAGVAGIIAAPARMVRNMTAPKSPALLVWSGGSKRVPLQGLCPEPGSFPRSGVPRRWLRNPVASGRVHRLLATKER